MRALIFLIQTGFTIVLSVFLLRTLLQWIRGNFKNPITQLITRFSNPLILPLRKALPPIGKLDTASLVSCLLIAFLMTVSILLLKGFNIDLLFSQPGLLIREVLRQLFLGLINLYWVLILFSIILNWVQAQQHSPLSAFLYELTEPVLKPARRLIKPIGGLDLSPIPVLILLTALQIQFSA